MSWENHKDKCDEMKKEPATYKEQRVEDKG